MGRVGQWWRYSVYPAVDRIDRETEEHYFVTRYLPDGKVVIHDHQIEKRSLENTILAWGAAPVPPEEYRRISLKGHL